MRRVIAAPFVLIALAVLISFALSNAQSVTIGLWPTGWTATLPLSVAILLSMAFAFLLGAMMLWAASLSARMRVRQAEDRVRMLQAQLDALRTTATVLPPPS
jgi:uncharacterized integral membrane protein